jgi:hypothetical protein
MAQTYQPDFGEIAQTRAQGMNVLSQMRQRDQELAQQNALAEYVKRGGLEQDPTGVLQFGAAGADMLNAYGSAKRAQTEEAKAAREAEKEINERKSIGRAESAWLLLNGDDTPETLNMANDIARQYGLDEDEISQTNEWLSQQSDRKAAIRAMASQNKDVADRIAAVSPKIEKLNLGNEYAFFDMSPNSPTYGKEVAPRVGINATPSALLAAQTAAENRVNAIKLEGMRQEGAAARAVVAKQGAVDEKRTLAQQNAVKYTEAAMDAVNQALPLVGAAESGILGAASSMIPGTPAYTLKNNYYSTIKSALSLERLAEIRQASPTGGALGNVSNQENKLLGDSIAALDVGLGEKEQERNLRKIYSALENINLINSGKTPIPRVQTDADAEKVPSGAAFYDPDFVKRVMP